ncbi:MAG TPA: hypothetical protein VIT23_01495, partial [Terrimicrobiaceae bacterium]
MQISGNSENDYWIDENGRQRFDKQNVLRSKLRVDTLLWVATRIPPQRYGERVPLTQVNVNGANGALSPQGDNSSGPQDLNVITPEVLEDLRERRRKSIERIRQANATEVTVK